MGHPHVHGIYSTYLKEIENYLIISTKVNTDENPDLKEMFNVDTYPRVLLFTKDAKYDPKKYEKKWGLKFEPLDNWLENELLSS